MHRRNSLHRVRMRKKRRVLSGISLGAKFTVVFIGLLVVGLTKMDLRGKEFL